MVRRWRASVNSLALAFFPAALLIGAGGCGGSAPAEPEGKARLTKLLRLYQVYVDKNKAGPPNETALRDFGKKLSAKERDDYLLGDDLDVIFMSPRDHEKYVVKYNLVLDPGQVRAVAWEPKDHGGMRFVALSVGYVEEYDEETFQQYKQ